MATVAELGTNCIDDVTHDKIKDVGRTVPVDSVSIQLSVEKKMFLKKLCIFSFVSPLDIKTKFYNSETSDLFLEVQIQNISSSTVFINKVSLQPPEIYEVEELNTVKQDGEDECTFGTRTFLQSAEGRQYLYHLHIKPEYSEKVGTIRGRMEMGKLDVIWKRNLGEIALLQTIQLEREATGYENLKLSLEEIPDTVILEEPFRITCKITNYSDKKMKLVLKLCDRDSVRWCGISRKYLGKLLPSASLCFTLTLLPLKLGLQSISGIRVKDKLLKKTYYYDDVANVCVVPSMVKMQS